MRQDKFKEIKGVKICIVDYDLSLYGGTGTVVASLAKELKKYHSVYLYSITAPVAEYYDKEGIVCYNLDVERKSLLQIRKEYGGKILNYLNNNDIDIVLLIGVSSAIIAQPFFKRTKCRFIYCDHGALANQLNDKKATVIRIMMSLFSDKIVVLTERTYNDYRRILKTPKKKLKVICNPIPQPALESASQCDLGSRKIISAGRFGREKGYDMLVSVAKNVLTKNKDWEWHIYGDGETFEEIRQEIINNGLENQLILKGKTDKLHELYKEYTILVLPSYREGLPMVLLEAQVNNIPIVSFDVVTGPAEIVEDNVNGFLVPMYDIDDMAEKIEILMNDDEKRKDFSSHAMDNIDRFRLQNVIKDWNELFDELLK